MEQHKSGLRGVPRAVRLGNVPVVVAALLSLVLVAPGRVAAEPTAGIAVTNNGASIGGNDPIYIDDTANFPMPQLTLKLNVNHDIGKGCPNISDIIWYVTVTYTDVDADDMYGLSDTFQISATIPWDGSATWAIPSTAWPEGYDLGGRVEVSATVEDANGSENGMPEPDPLYFYIEGHATSTFQTNLDNYYKSKGAPWFFPNLVGWESGGQQFDTSTGAPKININKGQCAGNDSEDIGVAQINNCTLSAIDAIENTSDPLWNYEANVDDALGVISSDAPGAYRFWDDQVYEMCQYLNGAYTGGYQNEAVDGSGQCSAAPQMPGTGAGAGGADIVPVTSHAFYAPQSLSNCSTEFPLQGGSLGLWKDSNVIKAYNGATWYYIQWYSNDPDLKQYWVFNTWSGTTNNNYVQNVCTAAPF